MSLIPLICATCGFDPCECTEWPEHSEQCEVCNDTVAECSCGNNPLI